MSKTNPWCVAQPGNAAPGKLSKRVKARLRILNKLWHESPTKETRAMIVEEAKQLSSCPIRQKQIIGMATAKGAFTDPKPEHLKRKKGNPYEHNPAFPDRI